jgi:hypothetical protein
MLCYEPQVGFRATRRLARYNKYTQYLARNVLLEIVRAYPEADWGPGIRRNPNYDPPLFGEVLGDRVAKWGPPEEPYLTEEAVTRYWLYDHGIEGAVDPCYGAGAAPLISLEYIFDREDLNWDWCEIAGRPDMTIGYANKMIHLPGAWCALLGNSVLDVDGLIPLCGSYNFWGIGFNATLRESHLSDPRIRKDATRHLGHNCAIPFDVAKIMQHAHGIYMGINQICLNPALTPAIIDRYNDNIRDVEDCVRSLERNKYTKDPVWRAICLRREEEESRWLDCTWVELIARLPPPVADVVLGFWFECIE